MTDNEIIKALECCLKGCNAEGCEDCPLYEKVEDCEIEIPIIALDLINRQKSEIERLKAENEGYKHLDTILRTAIDKLTANIKSEAIREFAKKLKYCVNYVHSPIGESVLYDAIGIINSLVKEMTEEKL